MDARWARRLVGGFVLVEQDEHARLPPGREQRGARPGRDPRRAVGKLPPRLSTSPLVHAGIEPDHAVELREPLRPPRRRFDIGRDHERAALRLLDPLEYLFLPTRSDQQRRTLVRRDATGTGGRSEEHTSELQSRLHLVCRLLLEKKNDPASHMLYIARLR